MEEGNIQQWFFGIPIITRVYITACTLQALALTFKFTTPLSLYLNFNLILGEKQWWRLLTNFMYVDTFGINYVFHMHFAYMYFCRLEEHFYHRRRADFLFMLLFGALLLTFVAYFTQVLFLSFSFLLYVMYVWCRRYPEENLNLFGLFAVRAPYMPYVFVGFSWVMGYSFQDDVVGIFVGHTYWYLADVVPQLCDIHLLRTPGIFRALFLDDDPP